ncbi:MAG: hypothetical protein QGG09_18615 [Pirellulaceae bacterium]|jgi:hypothetical protein|nr:hypothetical protein [Pirellulaceae bacterium]
MFCQRRTNHDGQREMMCSGRAEFGKVVDLRSEGTAQADRTTGLTKLGVTTFSTPSAAIRVSF